MAETTEQLIARLAAEAGPVRRLRPPAWRAALWLLAVAVVSAAAILACCDFDVMRERLRDSKLIIEMAATLLTGIVAVIAAFELSLPDRSRFWALLPVPLLAVWIASSGYSCYRHWIRFGPGGWQLGDSSNCFIFILSASVPLGISLLLLLRHAKPLSPVPVAAVGGLGVAAIAAFLLQFFHPFDVTIMDLAVHVAAVTIVVVTTSAIANLRPLSVDAGKAG